MGSLRYPHRLPHGAPIVNALLYCPGMQVSPSTRIADLGYLGARLAKKLKIMGIAEAGDLLRHLPFRYEDLSRTAPLAGPSDGPVTVRARIDMIRARR